MYFALPISFPVAPYIRRSSSNTSLCSLSASREGTLRSERVHQVIHRSEGDGALKTQHSTLNLEGLALKLLRFGESALGDERPGQASHGTQGRRVLWSERASPLIEHFAVGTFILFVSKNAPEDGFRLERVRVGRRQDVTLGFQSLACEPEATQSIPGRKIASANEHIERRVAGCVGPSVCCLTSTTRASTACACG